MALRPPGKEGRKPIARGYSSQTLDPGTTGHDTPLSRSAILFTVAEPSTLGAEANMAENPRVRDALAGTWAEIQQRLADYPVFPGVPLPTGSVTMLTVISEGDWSGFIDVGKKLGVPVFYIKQEVLTKELLDEVGGTEDEDLLKQLQRHLGETAGIKLGFVAGGVLHTWARDADWWVELGQGDELSASFRGTERDYQDDLRPRLSALPGYHEGWVRELAELPDYHVGNREWEVTREFLISKGIATPGFDFVQLLREEAHALFEAEVRTRIENEAIDQLATLYEAVNSAHSAWSSATTKARDQIASRFVRARYGFSMPAVARGPGALQAERLNY